MTVDAKTTPERAIVVCGARRTGTTLLAAVLSVDQTAPPFPGEAQLLPQWLRSYSWAKKWHSVRVLPFFADDDEYDRFYSGLLGLFLTHCREHFAPASTIILKSPELSLLFPEAHRLLPEAQFVVTVRDPRDQVASEWRVFENRRGSPRDLRVLRERDFAMLAREYVRYYEPIIDVLKRNPQRIQVTRFEDLVARTSSTVARLEAFTGLDLSGFDPTGEWPRMAESYWAYGSGPSDTPLYGQAIDSRRIGSYLDLLTPEEARTVEAICASVVERLGLDPYA